VALAVTIPVAGVDPAASRNCGLMDASIGQKRRKFRESSFDMTAWGVMVRGNRSRSKRGSFMAETVTQSLVQQFASMKPNEFGPTIEPKWQACERLVHEVRTSVEKKQLTPLDGARVISSITATLFGYDEFILREFSPETLLATTPHRR